MPTITVHLETPIRRTFRVEQVAGMFDVPLEHRLRHELTAELPGLNEKWTIGAIVGPSGSGKTTLARGAFGDAVWQPEEWPRERAVIDVLGQCAGSVRARECEGVREDGSQGRRDAYPTIKELARVLCGVGLGSVPTWLKPYHVLSTGEKFRADLAREVVGGGSLTQRHGGTEDAAARADRSTEYSVRSTAGLERGLIVFDEFTSSLDRTAAKTTSAALSRLLRSSAPHGPRLVAITCHDDILPWLSPDWTLRLGGSALVPRLVRQRPTQPTLELDIERVPQAMWVIFAPHHYLAGRLAASATCYAARLKDEGQSTKDEKKKLVAFCAVVAALGWKKTKRIQRLVVLPEFQGLGIGGKLLNAVAREEANKGNRVTVTASHPAILAHCTRSTQWRLIGVKKNGSTRQRFEGREVGCSAGRAVASFEWDG